MKRIFCLVLFPFRLGFPVQLGFPMIAYAAMALILLLSRLKQRFGRAADTAGRRPMWGFPTVSDRWIGTG